MEASGHGQIFWWSFFSEDAVFHHHKGEVSASLVDAVAVWNPCCSVKDDS